MKYLFCLFLGINLLMISMTSSFAAEEKPKKDNTEIELLAPFPDEEPIRVVSEDGKQKGAIYIMEQYVGKVFVFGAGLVVVLAVLWVIIGGYEIMFSGVASGEISSGKEKITKALLGLALVFLSGLILHTINPSFFVWG